MCCGILFGCCVWKNIVIDESFDVGRYMVLFGTLGPFVFVGVFFFFLGGFLLDYRKVAVWNFCHHSFFLFIWQFWALLFCLVWFFLFFSDLARFIVFRCGALFVSIFGVAIRDLGCFTWVHGRECTYKFGVPSWGPCSNTLHLLCFRRVCFFCNALFFLLV